MLYTYSITKQTVEPNNPIVFNTNGVLTGCTVSHEAGATGIKLNRAGYYLVHVNADVKEAEGNGKVGIQLLANGIPVNGAISVSNAQDTQDAESLSFTAIVQVLPNCCAIKDNLPLVLEVKHLGRTSVFTNAAMTVTKLC